MKKQAEMEAALQNGSLDARLLSIYGGAAAALEEQKETAAGTDPHLRGDLRFRP